MTTSLTISHDSVKRLTSTQKLAYMRLEGIVDARVHTNPGGARHIAVFLDGIRVCLLPQVTWDVAFDTVTGLIESGKIPRPALV